MVKFRKIQYSLVYNRTKRLNRNDEALIQIRAYQNSKSRYFSTGIWVKPEFWDSRNKKIKHSYPIQFVYNKQIKEQMEILEAYEISMINREGCFPIERLHEFQSSKSIPTNFTEFCLQSLDEFSHSRKGSTINDYKSSIGKLIGYRKSIHFHELTFDFITSFDIYLRKFDFGLNYIWKVHKVVKTFVNHAIKKGFIDPKENPYLVFKAKMVEPDRVFLTEEELGKIENLKIGDEQKELRKIRDYFLICCYLGFRVSDLIKLTRTNFIATEKGYVLHFRATKTNKILTLPLNLLFKEDGKEKSKIEVLVEKYLAKANKLGKGKELDNYLLFRVTAQYYNRSLKEIAKLAGIKKNLSSHVARRTFATVMSRKVKIPILQKMLSHSNIKMTLIYVHLSNKDIEDELKNIKW
jgi:integrase